MTPVPQKFSKFKIKILVREVNTAKLRIKCEPKFTLLAFQKICIKQIKKVNENGGEQKFHHKWAIEVYSVQVFFSLVEPINTFTYQHNPIHTTATTIIITIIRKTMTVLSDSTISINAHHYQTNNTVRKII